MLYIIIKGSRYPSPLTRESGYSGPSCDEANVPPGKVYSSKEEALKDAAKLTKINPVGFQVIELR